MTVDRREAIKACAAVLASSVFGEAASWGPESATDDASRLLKGAVNLADFEPLARERISRMAFEYGLGVAGEAGVAKVVTILKTELEMAMALSGTRSLAEIDRSRLWD